MKALALAGVPEGSWLRAERQTGGRGRSGRGWASPPGNLYASTLVRLRPGDPLAPTLALVAGLASYQAVAPFVRHPGNHRDDILLKWPNDLLIGTRKLGGVLLERVDDAVIVGIGVNLAHHPDGTERPTTSLAAEGRLHPPADAFLTDLARAFADALEIWRSEGLAPIRAAWLAAAHPVGTPLTTHAADGAPVAGTFDGLAPDGACRLRLADGGVRLIHAGDVFLV